MPAKLETKPVETNTGAPEVHHITCCEDDIALCRIDVTGFPRNNGEGEQRCVVCYDLNDDDIPCGPDCKF